MKLTSLFCTAVLTLALGGFALAQQTPAPATQTPSPAGEGHPKMKMEFLTPDEQSKLEAARKKAMESDPSLKADMEAMKQERKAMKDSGQKPTPEERQAMMAKRKAFEDKFDAATLKADPSVAPILEKVKAHRQQMMENFAHHKKDGAAAPAAPGTPAAQ